MKKVPVPMEMDSSGFYKDVSNHQGVQFDGNQHNGRHGSPSGHSLEHPGANSGVNFVYTKPDDKGDHIWEKKMGVDMNADGAFKDINDNHAKEVDLKPHVHVIGMPNPNINHNSSTDCYGGY